MFSWLNSRGKGDKEQSGKPKPNQDKNQSDFSILPKPQAKDNQQPNTSSQEETNTGVEIGNDQNRATSKSTQNRKSSNSNESPGGSSANLNSSADVTSIAPVRVEPIFIAPSLDLANTKQENVLGKNPDGSVIYISENPSADRASAQAGVGVSELPSSQTERIYSQQQEIAQTAVDSVVDRGKSVGATIKSTSPDSLTRIDSATKAATASIETEIEKQLSAIASLMNQSRSSISAASNKEIERIENHHANTISAIDARSETAVNQLEASAEKISQQMASSNATFSRRIDSVIEYNHAAISEKQQRARQTIDVIERTNIKKFRKQSPTKSDNPIVRALDNIGWNAYVTNWREAKIQVARGVAKASHQANTELFNNNFAKLAEYRTTTVNGGASLIASYQEALSNGHRQHKNAIRAKAGAALAQADQLKQQLITGVRQTESDLLGEVDNTEALYRQTLEQKKHSSTQELVTLGTKLGADVAGAISQGELRFNSAVASLSKGINTVGSFADLANAPAAAETAIAEIEFEKRKTQNEIERATANAEGQISEFANQIRSSLLAVTARAEAEQRQQQTRHNNQLLSSANSSTLFGRVLGGYNKSAEDEVTAATASWQQQSSNLIGQLSTAENNLSKQLNIAQDQIELQKQSQLRGIVKEIETQAPIEAAKVKPAWKKVVRIIVNVGISVATTVAIAALAMSGVGLVAAIGLFALIGAAGGVAKLAANDLIDGKTSSAKDYLKAGAIGALTGVIEGLGGRAVVGVGGKLGAQMLTKIEHMVASTGIEAVTNTLVELTESMGQGQDFTLKLLGVSILSSLLSTAGGKYIDFKFSDIGRGAARGATQQGVGKAAGQFATETAFDTAVETGASAARGEELSWESFGENLAGGILGRGAAGRADKLYGKKLRGLGNSRGSAGRRDGRVSDNNVTRASSANNTNDRNTGTTRNNSNSDTPSSNRAPRQPIPTNQKRNKEFSRVASEGLSRRVEVMSDPDLSGNTVRAEYKLNSRGVVQDVHLRVGPDATANDIKLHQHTVKVMRMYGGTLGKVRLVEAKIAKWVGIHGQPQTGTRAWEAQHEVPKLEKVISDRMKTLEEADPQEAQRLESEIENLTDQLKEHHRAFEAMDESDGVGYIAAKSSPSRGQTEHHNHLNAIVRPDDLIRLAYGEDNYARVLEDLWNIGGAKSAELQAFYKDNGLLSNDKLDLSSADATQLKEIAIKLMQVSTQVNFDKLYPVRSILNDKIKPEPYITAIFQELKRQKINYLEVQSNSIPGNISYQEFQKIQQKFEQDENYPIEIGFLKNAKTGTLGSTSRKTAKSGLKVVKDLEPGKDGVIGIDFAGPEAEFTPQGMEYFKQIYRDMVVKAEAANKTVVVRPHVGEGNPNTPHVPKKPGEKNKVEVARNNVELMVTAIEELKAAGELSDKAVIRLGHLTHASSQQLERVSRLGIIVEANLASNLVTGSVRDVDERNQVLLRFLYHDVKFTLNTDAGGIMNTTLPDEYKDARVILDDFMNNETGVTVEEKDPKTGKMIPKTYYYKDLPPKKRRNFNPNRLTRDAWQYRNNVAPNIPTN